MSTINLHLTPHAARTLLQLIANTPGSILTSKTTLSLVYNDLLRILEPSRPYSIGATGFEEASPIQNAIANLREAAAPLLNHLEEPREPQDGDLWYREDLDEYRMREDGKTITLVRPPPPSETTMLDRVKLNPLTIDPVEPQEGDLWYRKDLDGYRIHIGGKTITLESPPADLPQVVGAPVEFRSADGELEATARVASVEVKSQDETELLQTQLDTVTQRGLELQAEVEQLRKGVFDAAIVLEQDQRRIDTLTRTGKQVVAERDDLRAQLKGSK